MLWVSQEEIDEDDERLLEAFLSKDAGPQQTLADIIIKKIKENEASLSLGLIFHFKFIWQCLFCMSIR